MPSWILNSSNFLLTVRYGEPICVSMPNFVPIGRTFAEIWPIIDLQDGGRPPSWICFTCIWTIHEEHLLVFVSVQNLVRIGAVVSIIYQFNALRVWLKNAYSRPLFGGFWGIWPSRWDTISTNLTKVLSTGHSGSSGILLMLLSAEKLPGQNRCDEEAEEEEHEFWAFLTSF